MNIKKILSAFALVVMLLFIHVGAANASALQVEDTHHHLRGTVVQEKLAAINEKYSKRDAVHLGIIEPGDLREGVSLQSEAEMRAYGEKVDYYMLVEVGNQLQVAVARPPEDGFIGELFDFTFTQSPEEIAQVFSRYSYEGVTDAISTALDTASAPKEHSAGGWILIIIGGVALLALIIACPEILFFMAV